MQVHICTHNNNCGRKIISKVSLMTQLEVIPYTLSKGIDHIILSFLRVKNQKFLKTICHEILQPFNFDAI